VGPAAELRLDGEGKGRFVHHRPRGLDLHQGPGCGGGDDVAGVPGGWGHKGSLVFGCGRVQVERIGDILVEGVQWLCPSAKHFML